MKIAVTYADGQVYQHFGHAAQFKLYTVESGMILDTAVVDATASGHSAMVSYLQRQGVNTVICGGIGGGWPEPTRIGPASAAARSVPWPGQASACLPGRPAAPTRPCWPCWPGSWYTTQRLPKGIAGGTIKASLVKGK